MSLTLLGPVYFLSPDQQSGIHCLIICAIQPLTPNNLGGTWRRICSPGIRNVSALEVLRNRALQIDIYLLTCLLTGSEDPHVMKIEEVAPFQTVVGPAHTDRYLRATDHFW